MVRTDQRFATCAVAAASEGPCRLERAFGWKSIEGSVIVNFSTLVGGDATGGTRPAHRWVRGGCTTARQHRLGAIEDKDSSVIGTLRLKCHPSSIKVGVFPFDSAIVGRVPCRRRFAEIGEFKTFEGAIDGHVHLWAVNPIGFRIVVGVGIVIVVGVVWIIDVGVGGVGV